MAPDNASPLGGEGRLGHSLRSTGFRNLFGSTTASTLGASISLVSVSWIVYHYTDSSLDIAYLGLAGVVPGILLGLLAGVVADRYNRRSLMVTADLARMTGMGFLTVFLFVDGFSLPLILAVMVVVNCFSALFTPASQAILPQLVAQDSLDDANGLLLSSQGFGYSVGAAMGGVLVVVLGGVWGLGINALTYALSAVFLIQIASELGQPKSRSSTVRTRFGQDLSEGIGYVVRRRALLEVSFGYLPVNFLSSLVTPFLVVYATVRFGGDAVVFGSLAAAVAAGNIVGSLGVGRLRVRERAGWWMGGSILVEAGAVGFLAVSTNVAVSIFCLGAAGVTFGLANTIYYATMQRIVPRELLGRVLSFGDFGSFVAIPAGLVAGGVLIATYGVESSFLVAAVGILATGLVLLSLPGFRSFGQPAP